MPRRLSATLATPATASAGSPSASRPRTRTVRPEGASASSWPFLTVPAGKVPVTTVPAPLMVNDRSIQSRTGALAAGAGSLMAADQADEGGLEVVEPLAGHRADTDRFDGAEAGPRDLGAGLPGRRGGVGQVGAGDDQEAVADAEGVHGRQVLGGLRHPAAVGRHHEHDGGNRAEPGEHVRDESLVPRDVDERQPLPRRECHPGVAEVDGHAPAAFLRPAVGFHPGERADERGLAVVHVPRGRDDVHSAAPFSRLRAGECGRGRRQDSERSLIRAGRGHDGRDEAAVVVWSR